MSTRLLTFAAALLCGTAVVHAVRPKPPEPAPADAAKPAEPAKTPDPVEPYVLKNRSAFTGKPAESDSRAPFWPIGWVKRKPGVIVQATPAPSAPPVQLDANSFKVTSILIGSGTTPSLAVINGRAYSEGEFLRAPKGTPTTNRIRVQRINDGTVILQNATQTMVASLVRPELVSKHNEDNLLDPDR